MKKIIGYILLMTMVIIVIPFIIVKGCSTVVEDLIPMDEPEILEKNEVLYLDVYVASEGETKKMPLEEYLIGVVAAEMPAKFETEALKAQAVAARTYAYGRMKKIYASNNSDAHRGADVCTDSGHCQAWISRADAIKKWGEDSGKENWDKIKRAVNETENIIIWYENKVVNPLYHANSGGITENSENVWDGVEVPYLRSVKSKGEDASSEYEVVTTFKEEDFISAFKSELPDLKIEEENLLDQVEVLERTDSERVDRIKVGDVNLKGTDFRRILDLRSTNFIIEEEESGEIKITTIGYGHGVGMSQWGANHLAKEGKGFEEIIKHYYKEVELDNIKNIEENFENY
ncbi:stage II sporulation protein D [Herbivorax sp. ANBcel31]|uniref:stage II sporulation protein D n=1 Tax=Herbivorax sp. ANBcel31 TaxID=3069754 RepID=UPI0027B7952E|nr:stage II sporulation protein D [Herbivorax sp. ANBcel31]MDQ2087772.1 stage II sporulation protein D [Herbivorax sp. ANBcel31]